MDGYAEIFHMDPIPILNATSIAGVCYKGVHYAYDRNNPGCVVQVGECDHDLCVSAGTRIVGAIKSGLLADELVEQIDLLVASHHPGLIVGKMPPVASEPAKLPDASYSGTRDNAWVAEAYYGSDRNPHGN
jgi:hypothetical protein